jgi:GNAT superfamily N-acetyltransferase
MPFSLQKAAQRDAARLAVLHTSVAEHLTSSHGMGPWSGDTSEKAVLFALRNMSVFVAREDQEIIATFRLTTKKPWAIDRSYFTDRQKPLYLLAMAVTPARQRQGIGRWCLEQAKRVAKDWPADAIRLDAYDAEAGAGGFYEHCDFAEKGRVTYRGAPLIYYEWLISRNDYITPSS